MTQVACTSGCAMWGSVRGRASRAVGSETGAFESSGAFLRKEH
jgi:hypothetical protein